nr:hypothetical protein [Actinomycetota bacterium]
MLDHRARRLAVAVLTLLFGTGLMVTQAASALFAASAEPEQGIELTDDDDAAALFSATEMAPGSPVAACITVAYRSNEPIALRLSGRGDGGGLAPRLLVLVDVGHGGEFGDCDSFVRDFTAYRGTLPDLEGGVGIATTGVEGELAFRFTVEVADDNAAQGAETAAEFVWEAKAAPPEPVPGPVGGSDTDTVEPTPVPPTPVSDAAPEAPGPDADRPASAAPEAVADDDARA